jgi:hypothetical protein
MHYAVRPLQSREVLNVTDVKETGGSCLASDVEYSTFQGADGKPGRMTCRILKMPLRMTSPLVEC